MRLPYIRAVCEIRHVCHCRSELTRLEHAGWSLARWDCSIRRSAVPSDAHRCRLPSLSPCPLAPAPNTAQTLHARDPADAARVRRHAQHTPKTRSSPNPHRLSGASAALARPRYAVLVWRERRRINVRAPSCARHTGDSHSSTRTGKAASSYSRCRRRGVAP